MIKRKGKIRRGLILLGQALPTIGEFVGKLWRSEGGKRWLVPLIIFLCVTGLLLIVATSVEALAPFIYSIF
jgi:Family of unknown function (DUF5989)